MDLLYRALGRRLNLAIQIQLMPAERALLNANAGLDDGDVCRISGLEAEYPALVQVPEEILALKTVVFTSLPSFKVNGVESLRPYHVGILIGRKILEKKIVGTKTISRFSTVQAMFSALERNEIDAAILEFSEGLAALKQHKSIKALQPPLFRTGCYLYLNQKHRAQIPLIDAALKKMKRDGTYRAIVNKTLHPYLNGGEY